MGNCISCRTPSDGPGGKIVIPDGTVHELDRPISVAELMLEHPRNYVVELPSPSAGATKLVPLPADRTLDPDKVYMMLPMVPGKVATLSVNEARQIMSESRPVARSRLSSLSLIPSICMSGDAGKGGEVAGGKAKDGLSRRLDKARWPEWSPEDAEERPELLTRRNSNKAWKPSLGTIVEKSLERKVSHWLF